ncbi:MAG: SDR family NAD(P)-dependent oxidoreductase [Sandaracinaceae bacterium]
MDIRGKNVLVTGANRGLGRAFVDELLARGAKRIYAASRGGHEELAAIDPRVTPIPIDVTKPASIAAAAREVGELDLLINNAGSLAAYSLLETPRAAIETDFAVNFWGALEVTKTFVEKLGASKGAVLNILTVVSWAPMPAIGGYSASKAAAYSMTQALRAELVKLGITVHAAYPGPIDTQMIKTFEMDKTLPEIVAKNALAGVEEGTADIFPDPMSEQVGAAWRKDPRAVEAMFAAM